MSCHVTHLPKEVMGMGKWPRVPCSPRSLPGAQDANEHVWDSITCNNTCSSHKGKLRPGQGWGWCQLRSQDRAGRLLFACQAVPFSWTSSEMRAQLGHLM